MKRRVCPSCGLDWYSEDAEGIWWCSCGEMLPPELNEVAQ